MGGTAYLPLVVEIAFGADPLDTGTLTWTDVSAFVRRTDGVDFTRGWDAEPQQPLAGRLSLTLNNETGNFTPGEVGAFGLVRNRLPIRVSARIGTATGNPLSYDDSLGWYDMAGATYDDAEIGTVLLWTGLVESWRVGWTNGVRSAVQVTAVDRWAAIRRVKLDGRFVERIVASQSPDLFWPCTDASGDRLVASAGGRDFIPPGGTLTTAAAANPQQWLTLPVGRAASVGGVVPEMVTATSFTPTGATNIVFTVAAWIGPGGSAVIFRHKSLNQATVYINSPQINLSTSANTAGGAVVEVTNDTAAGSAVYSSGVPADAASWQHLAVVVTVNGSGALRCDFYKSGVLVGTDTTTYPSGGWAKAIASMDVRGSVAYVGVWNRALSAAELLAQYQAGTMAGWAGETAAQRAARLLTVADPVPSLSTTGTFTIPMSKQDLADKPLADALLECAQAEDGSLYIDTAGWPVITSRAWRTQAPVSFTIPATALSSGIAWTLDDQILANSATVDRMVGSVTAGTATGRNDASVTTYGEQKVSRQLWLHSSADAVERANAEANMWATPLPRSSDLTVDVLTKQATISATTLLAADIGQRIAISGLPTEAPSQTQFYIESISDRVTTSGWERTFTVSPRLDYLTLDDAASGALDSTFVLAP